MIGWLDASSGASGDMFLGMLFDAGIDPEVIGRAIHAVAPERIEVRHERVRRGAIAATQAFVEVADSQTHRGLSDVLGLIDGADLDASVALHASAVFRLLAEAEATVHGTSPDEVHFHEVGALDAIADIVGACAGLVALGLERLVCSPVAVGSGTVHAAHGPMSVPPPAVVELLRGIPSHAGPAARELCTPTGAALLRHWVDDWGAQPAMAVDRVGVGAGGSDLPTHANVLRLLVGVAVVDGARGPGQALVLETNVDDLDPRLWPAVLASLLAHGASDAWLTPILMKKGRPAHTLSVLVRPEVADVVRGVVFRETSAIGMRVRTVDKVELDREIVIVQVDGHPIRVKVASDAGVVVNRQPEYEDVAAAAAALDRPIKLVLAAAIAAAHLGERSPDA